MVMDIDKFSKKFSAHSFFLTIQGIRNGRGGLGWKDHIWGGQEVNFSKILRKNFSAH